MRAVSNAFLRTIVGSHKPVFRARVITTYQSGVSPVGTLLSPLSGNVVIDGTAAKRGTLDLTVDGFRMWPDHVADLLAPYGNEIFIERGVEYSDALVEMVGLGYFRIDSIEQSSPPDGPIRITGSDRMAGILDGRLVEVRQFADTDTVGSVVASLVSEVYPSATIEWDSGSATPLGRAAVAQESRHGFIDEIIRSLGKIWYWDHRGILVIKAVPESMTPVWSVEAGAYGALAGASRSLTRDGVSNVVIATGEGADSTDPARAVAFDNDPESPTYINGRFGIVPRAVTSPTITSLAQATEAAIATLRRESGLPYVLDIRSVPNCALEPFDPIQVRVATRVGVEYHVIEALTVPIGSGAMPVRTRERRVQLISVS